MKEALELQLQPGFETPPHLGLDINKLITEDAELAKLLEKSGVLAESEQSRSLAKFPRRDMLKFGAAGALAIGGVLAKSEKAQAQELFVTPVRSREEAASLFGINIGGDSASQRPELWRINQFGGAEFLGTNDGVHHPVLLTGAELEGWWQIKTGTNTLTPNPIVVHRGRAMVSTLSGTLWRHNNADLGLNKLLADVVRKTRTITYPIH